MKRTQVVVGILKKFNSASNKFEYLFNQRPLGLNKPYEGYWEFAGGKVEENESNVEALKRELFEELGIQIDDDTENNIQFVSTMTHDYEHASVELHFYTIKNWQGEPQCLEGQDLIWCNIENYPKPILPSLEYLIPILNDFNTK
jgi:8-oxo-dGTP diphosphatase